MPVTLKDVAALAGVSPSTVSRVCKDHPSISRQTKEKVRRAMDQLGYEPNFQAAGLATQNSRTIGIILSPPQSGRPTRTPSTWKPSGASACCATAASISAR